MTTTAAMMKTILHAVVNSIVGGDADADAVNTPMISGATNPGIVPKELEMPVMMPAKSGAMSRPLQAKPLKWKLVS